MSENPQFPENPYQQYPQYPAYPPQAGQNYGAYPVQPPLPVSAGTDSYANVAGRWLLWTALLFAIPGILAVYPGIQGILAIISLLPPLGTAIVGAVKTHALKTPGMRGIYLWTYGLAVPVFLGNIWVCVTVANTGDAGTTTYLPWFSMLAMLFVSISALAQSARLNPAIVTLRERFLANTALALLIGTTMAAVIMPVLVIMSVSFLVVGWAGYAFFLSIPALALLIIPIVLTYKTLGERKSNNGQPLPPGKLVRLGRLFAWSAMAACATLILVGTFLAMSIMGSYR